MIEDEWRYFAPNGAITPGGPSRWNILDWDQRRIIAVIMDEEQDSEDLAVEYLKRYIDELGPDVYAVDVSLDGNLLSTSNDPDEDEGRGMYYPPIEALEPPDDVQTISRSDLLEIGRLTPNVDLVSYTCPEKTAEPRMVVFKYYFLSQFTHKLWHEMNLWMRLPPHPHIVPLDRLVLDEIEGNVVGFTSVYIPGGTLSNDQSRTFKLKWLRQLMSVIDDLNVKYGIAHQDVSSRNLLVDPETDALMLFDFNYSGRIGGVRWGKDRDDIEGVIFTLYEIITRDTHFRMVAHPEQDPDQVQRLEAWVKHPDVKLDRPVEEFRSVLNEWVDKRHNGPQLDLYINAPECVDWPDLPIPPLKETRFFDSSRPSREFDKKDCNGHTLVERYDGLSLERRFARKEDIPTVNWERPAQITLSKGSRVLATGQSLQ